jgi:anaerobic selenocysteine-containing dehydrogenase
MPASDSVRRSFASAGLKVYFGLYENETSTASDLVIPAKTFLEKNDFRSSYGDYTFQEMPKIRDCETGISEYDLAAALCREFSIPFQSEEEYLDNFRHQIRDDNGIGYRPKRPEVPYEEGFENGEFEFLDEIDLDIGSEEGFFLITPKSPKGLNSQFQRPGGAYFHPESGFAQGERVRLSTKEGSVIMEVKHDERLRRDAVLIYSGTPDVNVLTAPLLSYDGENAVYQEYKIKVERYND